MSSKKQVLILMAVYNGKDYVQKQIESIVKQINCATTIHISIDQSDDDSHAYLQTLQSQHANIHLLPYGQRYGSACANFFRLIRESNFSDYDYIALADQDDIWHQDKLGTAIETLESKQIDAYSGNVTAFWPDGRQKLIQKAQPQCRWDYMFESAGPGCTFVMTNTLAMALQSHLLNCDTRHVALHDWYIYAFARSHGFQWFIDPVPHMQYRQHSNNVVGANTGIRAYLQRWHQMRDGWLIAQAQLIASLLGYTDLLPIQLIDSHRYLDRIKLVMNVHKIRRRIRDRFALAIYLLISKQTSDTKKP